MSESVVKAWQQALSGEYAAAFAYPMLGPRLTDAAQRSLAGADEQDHRDLIRAVREQLLVADQTPVEPESTYSLPFALTDPAAAQQLALRLESACAAAWRYLLATAATASPTTPASPSSGTPSGTSSATSSAPSVAPGLSGPGLLALRGSALSALTDSAVRAVGWRRLITAPTPTVAFPGI